MDREAIEEAIEVLEDASAEMLTETGDENYYAEAIAILRQALSGEAVKHIKTWSERCEEHPDHQTGMISERMIQARMQEEIDELRQALETEQEPVAWISDSPTKGNGKQLHWTKSDAWRWSSNITPLYTAPQKKQLVGLTDEEVSDVIDNVLEGGGWLDVARAIEQALKEKNT